MAENNHGADMRLDAIIDYEMDTLEAKAYKLTLLWLDRSKSFFPNYAHDRMVKKGDPRKSQIFKFCYKLARETQGILEENDYPLYVRAQLEILKHISKGRKDHALISPNCLAGEKAWVRWKLWKRKYDDRSKVMENKVPIAANQLKVADAITRTKEFFVKTFGPELTDQNLRDAHLNKNFQRWVALGKISPYYLVMSPLIARVFTDEELNKAVTFDLTVYRETITPENREMFKKNFPKEFNDNCD